MNTPIRYNLSHNDYSQNPITLWFKDKKLEQTFRATHTKKTLFQVRLALIVGAIIYSLFSILDMMMLSQDTPTVLAIRFAFAVPAFIVGLGLTYVDYFRKKLQLLVASLIFVAGIGVAVIAIMYEEATSDLYLAGTLIPIFWAFLFSGLRIVASIVSCFSLLIGYDVAIYFFSHYSASAFISYNFFLVTSTMVGMLGGYTIERYYRRDFVNSRIINEKRKENERLLLSILPKPIAEELKQHRKIIAKGHNNLVILFADLVNFTNLFHKLPPDKVVDILNEIFSIFDRLTDKYRLEKIKTIGDAYMVVGGLHDSSTRDLFAISDFALEMREQIQIYNDQHHEEIQVRIGIHCGAAVAGVIGIKKFSFDIWGDAVNIASRLESTAPPGEIQVSSAIYYQLSEAYAFIDRGNINIKGKGSMHTFLLQGKVAATNNQIRDENVQSKDLA